MAMLKKKDDGDKKPFSNSGKYGLGTVAKTVKTQGEMKSAPKKSAVSKTLVKSESSSKSSPKKNVKVMKSKLTKKGPVSSAKPKMQKTPWILKQTTGVDSMPSLEGKSKQYRDSVTMETYKKGGYRIK